VVLLSGERGDQRRPGTPRRSRCCHAVLHSFTKRVDQKHHDHPYGKERWWKWNGNGVGLLVVNARHAHRPVGISLGTNLLVVSIVHTHPVPTLGLSGLRCTGRRTVQAFNADRGREGTARPGSSLNAYSTCRSCDAFSLQCE
jgi:hypothetical protein